MFAIERRRAGGWRWRHDEYNGRDSG
jgi:hypothetical protein